MKLHFIRNATLRLNYAGHTLLIDPFLAPKHIFPPFAGRSKNPTADLPVSPQAVIEGVEMILVSHLHPDHFGPMAQALLPKNIPLLCQPRDETAIKEYGFLNVSPLTIEMTWHGMTIKRVLGQHGSSEAVLKEMGLVSGFIFEAADEPTMYWTGDTIWYEAIQENIKQASPDIIITHSGGAVWGDQELIIMDAEQTVALCQFAPQSTVVAVHLEALDHCLTSRADLRACAREHGVADERLHIPADGEILEF